MINGRGPSGLRPFVLGILITVFSLVVTDGILPRAFADDRTAIEKLSVIGKKESLPTQPGSAHLIDEAELEKFRFNDIHRVLRSVPGVNIQEEEGFGLRPNIGLRGGHPHRSKKVTLMEDGVLIAPAPYAAPAAYYFPQMDKLGSVEIFKGVPSTRFGPNSIGGAINMVTRINEPGVSLGLTGGSFDFNKQDISIGYDGYGDFSLDITRINTTGFKELAGFDDTGFTRQNVTFKWDKYFVTRNQNISLKFNWSDEVSNETYAGLTSDDFSANPFRRYAGTQVDTMDWTHRQFLGSYAVDLAESLRFRTTLYYHRFARSWDKVIGFYNDGPAGITALEPPSLSNMLKDPTGLNAPFFDVFNGTSNSGALSDNLDVLDVGDNQRQYYSQGIQFNLDHEANDTIIPLDLNVFYRFHQDGISRFHESRYFNMTGGQMIQNTGLGKDTTLDNEGKATAQTLMVNYETQISDFSLQVVNRVDQIHYEQSNIIGSNIGDFENSETLWAPGAGVFYQFYPSGGFLFGVNKGYTPQGPPQSQAEADSIDPEEALNWELGFRHSGDRLGVELIAFYSDYTNVLGNCTQSVGCPLNTIDQNFNGGGADIVGVEALFNYRFQTKSINFPVTLSLTHNQAKFRNTFVSGFNEWGIGTVNSGDPIPYIPEWNANLVFGLEWKSLNTYLNLNYLGRMADQAVAVDVNGFSREYIEDRLVVSLAASYEITENWQVNGRVDNLLDEKYAVSMRPFGLRPGRPQMFMLGMEYVFR